VVAAVQAFGSPASDDGDESISVTLNLADALGCGYSLVALTHNALVKMPESTKVIYRRVGLQLVAAAKLEMAQRIAIARESGAKAGAR
jgi:hypothetical protein